MLKSSKMETRRTMAIVSWVEVGILMMKGLMVGISSLTIKTAAMPKPIDVGTLILPLRFRG